MGPGDTFKNLPVGLKWVSWVLVVAGCVAWCDQAGQHKDVVQEVAAAITGTAWVTRTTSLTVLTHGQSSLPHTFLLMSN